MWQVSERRRNKWRIEPDQIKIFSTGKQKTTEPIPLTVILNTVVFFKKDTIFT